MSRQARMALLLLVIGGIPGAGWCAGRPRNEQALLRSVGGAVCSVLGGDERATGFLVDAQGIILTTSRAVAGARNLSVMFGDSARYEAMLLVHDRSLNIAALRVAPGVAARAKVLSFATDMDALAVSDLEVGGEAQSDSDSQLDGSVESRGSVFGIAAPAYRPKSISRGQMLSLQRGRVACAIDLPRDGGGSPLVNRDGEVVAIAVEGDLEGVDGVRGVMADDLEVLLSHAKEMIARVRTPDDGALPVVLEAIPIEWLQEAQTMIAIDERNYRLADQDGFVVTLVTPTYDQWRIQRYRALTRPSKVETSGDMEVDPLQEWLDWSLDAWGRFRLQLTLQISPKQPSESSGVMRGIGSVLGGAISNYSGAASGVAGSLGSLPFGGGARAAATGILRIEMARREAGASSDASWETIHEVDAHRLSLPWPMTCGDWKNPDASSSQAIVATYSYFFGQMFKAPGLKCCYTPYEFKLRIWSARNPAKPIEMKWSVKRMEPIREDVVGLMLLVDGRAR